MQYKINVTNKKRRFEKIYELSTEINGSVIQYAGKTQSCVTFKGQIHSCTSMACYSGPENHTAAFPLCQSTSCGLIYTSVVSLHSVLPKQCHNSSYPPNPLLILFKHSTCRKLKYNISNIVILHTITLVCSGLFFAPNVILLVTQRRAVGLEQHV